MTDALFRAPRDVPTGTGPARPATASSAAERYKLSQDSDAYERLVQRYGEPDHPLVHRARAAVFEDYQGMARWSAPAVAALRARGEDDLADQLELDVGGGMLVMLGYSASLQGEHDRANQLFGRAISVEVPRRIHSPNQAVEARTVFLRGDRARGFEILLGGPGLADPGRGSRADHRRGRPGGGKGLGQGLEDRQALEYMLGVLRLGPSAGGLDAAGDLGSGGDLGAEQAELLEHGRVGEGEQVQLARGG